MQSVRIVHLLPHAHHVEMVVALHAVIILVHPHAHLAEMVVALHAATIPRHQDVQTVHRVALVIAKEIAKGIVMDNAIYYVVDAVNLPAMMVVIHNAAILVALHVLGACLNVKVVVLILATITVILK